MLHKSQYNIGSYAELKLNDIVGNIKFKKYEDDHFLIRYKGVLFSNKGSDLETIKFYLVPYLKKSEGIGVPFGEFLGNYIIEATNKINQEKMVFSDNSGMCYWYYTSTQYSYEIKNLLNTAKLDLNGISNFIFTGTFQPYKTAFQEIQKLSKNEYLVIKNSNISLRKKNISNFSEPKDKMDIEKAFDLFSNAYKNKKISIDLTGGYDSRLIASVLSYLGIKFEASVSGVKGIYDIEAAEEISKILNIDFHPYYHEINEDTFNLNILKSILELGEYEIDIFQFHRNYFLAENRVNRNIDVQLSGIGGEAYKDAWWLQDFPFYNSKKINIKKLIKSRVFFSISNRHLYSDNVQKNALQLFDQMYDHMNMFKLESNTQTYDNIAYNYRILRNSSRYLQTYNKILLSYAPLLELNLMRTAFDLPRNQRFFNLFHRKCITKFAPQIAKIKTTEGTSASYHKLDLLKDFSSYAWDKQKRVSKYVLRRLTKKTFFQTNPSNQNMFEIAKKWKINAEIDQILKDSNILNGKTRLTDVPNSEYARIFTIGLFLKENKINV